MPRYCFRLVKDNSLVEKEMTIAQMEATKNGCNTYLLDEGIALRDYHAESGHFRDTPGLWEGGIVSDALGVDPSQVAQCMKEARENGFTEKQVNFDSEGRCFMDSRKTRKRYMEFRGVHDRDGGYGD